MNKASAFLAVVPLFAGCALGPAHLPALYAQRDNYTKMIEDIETRYHLPSRKNEQDDALQNLRKQVDELRGVNQRLVEENQRVREESQEFQWFRSLPPQEQIQWRMHRDAVKAGRTGEYTVAPPRVPAVAPAGGPRPGPVTETPAPADEDQSLDDAPVDPADLPGQPESPGQPDKSAGTQG